MAKEIWKIDKFKGGINDYTDPKDIKSSEFVELQDCSVGKLGQIKNMGKPLVNESLGSIIIIDGVDTTNNGSVDTFGGLLPGKGFYKSPNDYDMGESSRAGSALVTIQHSTLPSDGTKASCQFEVLSMLAILRQVSNEATSDLDIIIRLQAKHITTNDILPASTAGFDASVGWNVLENFNQGDLSSEFDNDNITYNGITFTPLPIVNSAWWITSYHEEIFNANNLRILGHPTSKAIGFHKYVGLAGYDTLVRTIHMPYFNTDGFDIGNYDFGQIQYELMRHSFLRKIAVLINARSSAPNVTCEYFGIGSGKIKLTATTVGVTLNDYQIHATIDIINEVNAVADTTFAPIKSNINSDIQSANGGHFITSGGNVFQGGTIPVADVWKIKIEGQQFNNDEIRVSVFMNDGAAPQGEIQQRPFIFDNTHVTIAEEIRVVCDTIAGITATKDTTSANFTYVVLTAGATGVSNGFTVQTSIQPKDGFFSTSANNEQHILYTLSYKDMNLHGGEEFGKDLYGFPLLNDAAAADILGGYYPMLVSSSPGFEGTVRNVYGTRLNIYSSTNNSWTTYNGKAPFHPTGAFNDVIDNTFDWVWAAESQEYPQPNFYNDGNTLVMTDGNFNLPNPNYIFGYIDRSRFFRTVDHDEAGEEGIAHEHDEGGTEHNHHWFADMQYFRKWIKWPERKVWSFTQDNYYGARNPHWAWNGNNGRFGVLLRGDDNWWGDNMDSVELNESGFFGDSSQMAYQHTVFRKHNSEEYYEQGAIDWGGTQDTFDAEGDLISAGAAPRYKFYLSAVYNDGSETLPVHKFIFGTSRMPTHDEDGTSYNGGDFLETDGVDYMEFEHNEYLAAVFCSIIPQSHVAMTASSEYTEDANNPLIMNQLCYPDPRVSGFRCYYTDSTENYETYWHLATWDFELGVRKEGDSNWDRWKLHPGDDVQGIYNERYAHIDNLANGLVMMGGFLKKPKGATYEFFNGFDPKDNTETIIRYKHSVMVGNRVFIGNIETETEPTRDAPGVKKLFNDRMVMSLAGKLSSFPYPNNIFDLNISDGDEITALASESSKILQFKKGILYIVDTSSQIPEQFFISETHRHKGIPTSNHFCNTTEGVFFFNSYGAWLYDGEELKDIFVNTDDQDKKQQRIDPATWRAFVNDNNQCGFNPVSNEVIILKSNYQSSDDTDGDSYTYDVYADAWTFGRKKFHIEHTSGLRNLTNFSHVGADLSLAYIAKEFEHTDTIAKLFLWDYTGQTTEDFVIVTKVTDLGDPRSYKSILGLIVNCVQSSANSTYTLQVEWREGPGKDWASLDTITNVATANTIAALNHQHIFNPIAVKGIRTVQLRFTGNIEGDFGINDISLVFRKYKTDNISIFKADVD
tara:strand:+ start:6898 stop:10989 length:4092 start_codon:yes stop_codon:yes gene_type:complete